MSQAEGRFEVFLGALAVEPPLIFCRRQRWPCYPSREGEDKNLGVECEFLCSGCP